MRNESAASLLGRADMGWVVYVEAQLVSKADLDAAYALQDSIEAEASLNQQGIFALSIMNMTEGTRCMCYSTSNPAGLVEKAFALCEQCPLPTTISCQYDPNWSWWCPKKYADIKRQANNGISIVQNFLLKQRNLANLNY